MLKVFRTALIGAAMVAGVIAVSAPASAVTWSDCEDGGGVVILEQNGQYTCIHGFYGDMQVFP
ncbi:hypothetical protein [Nocardia arizonensis]|uniref:hypothetical protein n=1 Tax=Nocardia arizonensis TaxID=1141647 RepID=UPI0006D0F873|nr:hypothetical protein [Nocardia arizonensis]